MKLLVTGGTGFIGSHLAESALRAGHQVKILGLTDTESDRKNANFLNSLGGEIFSGSITDADLCDLAMTGATHVYHLAVAMREAGLSDQYFTEVNLEGTRRLLLAAKAQSVRRFIYCGTIGIYGHRITGIATEKSALAPGNIYEKTKLAAETIVLDFHRDTGLPVTVLRPADVYGPRDQRLLKLFRAIYHGRFPLFGNGNGRRHMVYVDDVVNAFEKALESEDAVGEAMIIGGPGICTLRGLIEEIRIACCRSRYGIQLPLAPMLFLAGVIEDVFTAIGWTPPIYRRRMDFFTSDSAFDISHAMKTLKWEAKVGLEEGVLLTLEAYRREGQLA